MQYQYLTNTQYRQLKGEFKEFIKLNSRKLLLGHKLDWPPHLSHPNDYGFSLWQGPTDHVPGKIRDWVFSIWVKGKGRFHVWEFWDGTFKIHYDKHDPVKGPIDMLNHVLHESKSSPIVGSLILIGGIYLTTKLLTQQPKRIKYGTQNQRKKRRAYRR